MAVVLDATVGGAASNTYATLAEANTYHQGHPYSSVWDDATVDEKNRALVTATRLLDEQVEWIGSVVTETQRLLWPRVGAVGANGYPVAETVLPEKLKEATAEFARQLLATDRTADSETEGVKSLKAASIEIEFTGGGRPIEDVVPTSVRQMVAAWGEIATQATTSGLRRLVRC